jgi:ABC-type multidrug transport system fused ATPase/permease subunit
MSGADKLDVSVANPEGKLVIPEEKGTGRVSRGTLWRYFASSGGVVFWIIFTIDVVGGEMLYAYCNYFLGSWSKAYESATEPGAVHIGWWIGICVSLMILQVGAYNSLSLMWTFGSLRAAKDLHSRLVNQILGAPMRFLDQTPIGRLVGRFTKDMKSVDIGLPRLFVYVSQIIVTLALKFVLLIWLVPTFAPYAVLTGVLGFLLGEFYIKAQLSIKREMSNAKTPVYTHFARLHMVWFR